MSAVNRMVGGYRLTVRAGSGAWFTVFHADGPRHRPVVVKVVHRFLLSHRQFVNRLTALMHRRLRLVHPGLVAVFEMGSDDDGLWTAEEYVDGRSLLPWFAADIGEEARGLHVVAKVLSALAYAHDSGMVHGCVHPGAVRVDASGEPKLGDFGFRTADPGLLGPRTTGELDYHHRYGAPESRTGTATTVAGDIYSVGMLLADCVGGGQHSRAVSGVVRRATDPDPAHRYPSAARMAAAVTAIGDGEH